MIRTILSVIALSMSIGFAYSHTAPRIEVYEYGTYASPPGVVEGLTSQGMVYLALDYVDLIQSTRTVVGQLGVQFGFRYRLSGIPSDEAIPITIVMKFPSPGIIAPGGSLPFVQDDYTVVLTAGDDLYEGWSFSDRSQIVPGIWTFEIWHGDKKLAEQKFNVILPPIA